MIASGYPYLRKPPRGTPADGTNPLAANGRLANFYPLNEGAGSTVSDVGSARAPMTLTGATWATGQWGSCLSFNGSNQYGSAATTAIAGPPLTLAGWFSLSSLPPFNDGCTIASLQNTSATDDEYWIDYARYSGNGWLRLVSQTSAGAYFLQVQTTAITTNTWYHLAGVAASNSAYTLYLNGKALTGGSFVNSPLTTTAFNTASIGVVIDSGGPISVTSMTGSIDLPVFLGRALSAGEVAYLYSRPLELFRPQIQPSWLYQSSASSLRFRRSLFDRAGSRGVS